MARIKATDSHVDWRYLNVIFGQRAGLPLSWPKTCWLLLACYVRALMSWTAFAQYSFGLTATPPPWQYFLWPCGHASRGLTSPLTLTFYLAFRPCLMALIDFIRASSRRYPFFLRPTAIINFSLPHGRNRFHSAWRRVTPHGNNRFLLCLTGIIDFFFA